MTCPGVEGVVGPPPLTATGQQIRQSTAGGYPGNRSWTTVIDAMGSHAPAWAKTAEAVTTMDEYNAEPHPIEKDNFEEGVSEGGIDQFGVDQDNPSHFDDEAVDPTFPGQPRYEGQ
jgi:hypothetical protein